MALPAIGKATANLARTISAPAVQPVSGAISTLRNPAAAMDLPPILSAAGGFVQDASSGLFLPRGLSGGSSEESKATQTKLQHIDNNTEKTQDALGDGLPAMIAILSRIEANTRGPSEEDLMEAKRKKAAQKKEDKDGEKAERDSKTTASGTLSSIIDTIGDVVTGRALGRLATAGLAGGAGALGKKPKATTAKGKVKTPKVAGARRAAMKGMGKTLLKGAGKVAGPLAVITGAALSIEAGLREGLRDDKPDRSALRTVFDVKDRIGAALISSLSLGLVEEEDAFNFMQVATDFLFNFGNSVIKFFKETDWGELWTKVKTKATEMLTSVATSVMGSMTEFFTGEDSGFRMLFDKVAPVVKSLFDDSMFYIQQGIALAVNGLVAIKSSIMKFIFLKIAGFGKMIENLGVEMGFLGGPVVSLGRSISEFGNERAGRFHDKLQIAEGKSEQIRALKPPSERESSAGAQGVSVVDASSTSISTTQMSGAKPPVTPEPAAFGE